MTDPIRPSAIGTHAAVERTGRAKLSQTATMRTPTPGLVRQMGSLASRTVGIDISALMTRTAIAETMIVSGNDAYQESVYGRARRRDPRVKHRSRKHVLAQIVASEPHWT